LIDVAVVGVDAVIEETVGAVVSTLYVAIAADHVTIEL
jgi:hypothetical protein